MVVYKKNANFAPVKIDVEGFGLLATTKKMLNQQFSYTTVSLPYVNCLIKKNY
jgi:hypothetical protein